MSGIEISIEEYNKKMSRIIGKNRDIDEALIALLDEASKYTIASDVTKGVTNVQSNRSRQKKGKHGQKLSKTSK